MRIVTVEQMRAAEEAAERLGISARLLMENAGARTAELLENSFSCKGKQVVLICGKGNNGGDACVVARHLLGVAGRVTLILAEGQPATKQAHEMYERLTGGAVEIITAAFEQNSAFRRIAAADLLVDGLYGIGFRGRLDGLPRQLMAAFDAAEGRKLALDLPSGMLADSGVCDPATPTVDATVVFGALKAGQLTEIGRAACGRLCPVDIGIPDAAFGTEHCRYLLEQGLVRQILPRRFADCNKGDFGRALLLCGSRPMSGAAVLSTLGTLRCGAGLTTLAVPASLANALAGRLIENTFLPLPETAEGFPSALGIPALLRAAENKSVVLAGCGLGTGADSAALVGALISELRCPLILDADGLNLAARHKDEWKTRSCPLILTPHPGEMARLTGKTVSEIQKNRTEEAKRLAADWQAVVVLKGHQTVIAGPDGTVYQNQTGNPGLAKGGSGDLLAGMMTGLAAQKIPLTEAAAAAVWLHGRAADLAVSETGEQGLLASDLLPFLGRLFALLKR